MGSSGDPTEAEASPATARDVGASLVYSAAETARLLPELPEDAAPDAFPLEPSDKKTPPGGLKFEIVDLVAGQPVPPTRSAWLTIEPFKDANGDRDVLRARMRFLYQFMVFSMTVRGDWHTQLSHFLRDVPDHEFRWFPMLYQLTGGAYARPEMLRSMAALRWGHPRFLLDIHCRRGESHAHLAEQLEQFLMALDAATHRGREQQERRKRGEPEIVEDDVYDDIRFADYVRLMAGDQDFKTLPRRDRNVDLGLSFMGGSFSAALVRDLVDVLERFAIAEDERRAMGHDNLVLTGISFRVTTIVFGYAVEMDDEALETLASLVANSKYLHVDTLRVSRDGDFQRLPLQKTLIDCTSLRDPKSTRPGRLQRLTFENTGKSFAAFGSALRYDTTLREIELGYHAGDMDTFAAWLAFGVFHRDSRSNITSVCLRMPFRYGPYGTVWKGPPYEMCSRRWIEVFKRSLTRVASSKDLAFVHSRILRGDRKKKLPRLEEVKLPTNRRVFVEVKPSAHAYEQPQKHAKKIVLTVVDQDYGDGVRQFEVVRKLDKWTAIVIPGMGVGWIQENTVVRELAIPTATGQSGKHRRVKSFTWTGGFFPEDDALKDQHADSLMDLLALIGEPLEVLQLPSMGLQNRHVKRIVRYCPNLRELNIAGNKITDIGAIVNAYETGKCHITSLSVAQSGEYHLRIIAHAARIVELCNFPRDATTTGPYRPILRQLAVRVSPFSLVELLAYYDVGFSALKKAILGEQGLEYVRLHCHRNEHQDTMDAFANFLPRNGEVYDPGESEEEEYNLSEGDGFEDDEVESFPVETDEWSVRPPPPEPVWVSRSLPLRSRLAFLSTMHHNSTTGGRQFDPHVLMLIFEMARNRQPRMIEVVPDEHGFALNEYFV